LILSIAEDAAAKDRKVQARVIRASFDDNPERAMEPADPKNSIPTVRLEIGYTVDFSDINDPPGIIQTLAEKEGRKRHWAAKLKMLFSYILCPAMRDQKPPLYVDPLVGSVVARDTSAKQKEEDDHSDSSQVTYDSCVSWSTGGHARKCSQTSDEEGRSRRSSLSTATTLCGQENATAELPVPEK